MSSNSQSHKSIWLEGQSVPRYESLNHDIAVDVCIVGAGIAGLTSAYLLMKEGKSVCLLESQEFLSGQSGQTTAQFCTALDERYQQIEKHHGQENTRLIAESHRHAIELVRSILQEEQIECEQRILSGYLFSDLSRGGSSEIDLLNQELECCHRAGLSEVKFLEKSLLDTFLTGPCLVFSQQLTLNPRKYLLALAQILTRKGVQIFTHSRVVHIEGGRQAYVETDKAHKVRCTDILVATNTPINNTFAIHTKQAAYRSYVIGLKIPKGSIPDALYWDTHDPLHYLRLVNQQNYDILLVGGEDHKTGQDDLPQIHYKNLEAWTRERFPMVSEMLYNWSGQIMQTVDAIAYLGHNPLDAKNVFVITGDCGNGMTYSTIGAMLITDQIMGRENKWEKIYQPARIALSASTKFLKENLNVAKQYATWIKPMPKPNFINMSKESGLVFRNHVKLVAAYKNRAGSLEFLSATCPHLGGVMSWNDAEKSWDCPCHGSRFDRHGKVIEGPAFENMQALESKE